MKKYYPFLILLIWSMFLFVACDKENEVNINHLIGKWSVTYDPNLVVEGSVSYTFNVDKTCDIHIYDALSNRDTTIYRTYILGNDNKLITLFNEDKVYTEQYTVTKLTSSEMKWINASPGDGNDDKRLLKY